MLAKTEEKMIDDLRQSTIRREIGPTILLGSGNYFDYENPDGSEITIEDVAYGLGFEGRFSGQCYSRYLKKRKMYAVAQHCVLMSYAVVEEQALEALMHESGEAVCKDVNAPLKSLLPGYKVIEKRCDHSIASRFAPPRRFALEIKTADVRMLVTERRDMMNWGGETWSDGDIHKPYDFRIIPWSPDDAAQAFLDRYRELTVPGFKRSDLLIRLLAEAGL